MLAMGSISSIQVLPIPVPLNGGVSPMTPALSMTPASVLVPVASPRLSPLVRLYCLPPPSPCALGQQVIALLFPLLHYCLETLLFDVASSCAIVWTSLLLSPTIVLAPLL